MNTGEPAGPFIRIRGAREGGLQAVDVDIPLGAISCVLGPSGSGHRVVLERILSGESRARYMQALAPSQREGLVGGFRVDVDSVSGLPPVINYLHGNKIPSGTVASYMGIERLLAHHFLTRGHWRCPSCGGRCAAYRAEEVEGAVRAQVGDGQVTVLAPLRESAASGGPSLWGELRRAGFVRVRIDGEISRLDGDTSSWSPERVEVVVDRLRTGGDSGRRFLEAIRSARAISRGASLILDSNERIWPMNQSLTCQVCARELGDISQDMLLREDPRAEHLYIEEHPWSQTRKETVRIVDAVLAATGEQIVRLVLAELCQLGLHHLPLGQPLSTLSHSEWQRLRLAFCLCSRMAGILYVFEGVVSCVEGALRSAVLGALQRLVEGGNAVVLVDAASEAQRIASRVWEFSEGRCRALGDLLHLGGIEDELHAGDGVCWQLAGEGAWGKIDIRLPQGAIIGIVGESGSGKTRFLLDAVEPALREKNTPYRALLSARKPRVHVPLRALGRQTLLEALGIHVPVAELFATAPMGVELGYPSEFYRTDKSGGRCPACSGRGRTALDLDFIEDVESICSVCAGSRFRDEVLQVTYRGLHVGHVLEMNLGRARQVFARQKNIANRLRWVEHSDLDYLPLGVDTDQLEWGESLRLQLAMALKGKASDRDLILIDHLTPGMHPREVEQIVSLLKRIALMGGTVLVADAHPHVLSACAALVRIGRENGQRTARTI